MDQIDEAIQRALPRYLTNAGHGHVWRRPDGMVARCGGPALCRACMADRGALDAARQAVGAAL